MVLPVYILVRQCSEIEEHISTLVILISVVWSHQMDCEFDVYHILNPKAQEMYSHYELWSNLVRWSLREKGMKKNENPSWRHEKEKNASMNIFG